MKRGLSLTGLISGERRELVWAIISASARGRLAMRLGHLPPAGHRMAEDFTSVAVAPTADPRLEDVLLARLAELGVRRVRLDFTYGDAGGPAERLLERLCAAGYRVTLHLLQPFAAARRMPATDACEEWAHFCDATLDRHGARIVDVEATSTINRRRWAGYRVSGMLAAWRIAHDAVRRHGLPLAGPSITDFEPALNVGVLALLRKRNMLPDLHADNLFCERSTEPERWDHKIFGHWAAPWISFNLVKKARLLARVGADAGVPRLISPAAFWTLSRIERVLSDSEEKQADYLARYFVLCAASGALEPPTRDAALRHARNAIWTVDDPRHPGGKLVVKQPVKHHLHKKLLDRLKPSKARRSWNGACELLRRGVATAAPVAWLEARDGADLTRNWYVCEYVAGGLSVGSLFTAYTRGEPAPQGIAPATAHPRLAEFLVRMHNRGLFFRDLSGGNILIRVAEDGAPEFSLIDTARIRVYRDGVPPRHRLSDLARACHKLHPAGRLEFLAAYAAALGRPLGAFARLRFGLYDFKAGLKRWLRRTRFYQRLKR